MLYIGIDGGGTKTKMVLFDEKGSRLKRINTSYSTCFNSATRSIY